MYLTTLFYGSPYPSHVLSTKKHRFSNLNRPLRKRVTIADLNEVLLLEIVDMHTNRFYWQLVSIPRLLIRRYVIVPLTSMLLDWKGIWMTEQNVLWSLFSVEWMYIENLLYKCHTKTIPAIHVVFEYLQKRTPIQICITPQKSLIIVIAWRLLHTIWPAIYSMETWTLSLILNI